MKKNNWAMNDDNIHIQSISPLLAELYGVFSNATTVAKWSFRTIILWVLSMIGSGRMRACEKSLQLINIQSWNGW